MTEQHEAERQAWASFKEAAAKLVRVLKQREPTTRSGGARVTVDDETWALDFEREGASKESVKATAAWVMIGDERPGDLWRVVPLEKGDVDVQNLGIVTKAPAGVFNGFRMTLNEAPVECLLEQSDGELLLRFRTPRALVRPGGKREASGFSQPHRSG